MTTQQTSDSELSDLLAKTSSELDALHKLERVILSPLLFSYVGHTLVKALLSLIRAASVKAKSLSPADVKHLDRLVATVMDWHRQPSAFATDIRALSFPIPYHYSLTTTLELLVKYPAMTLASTARNAQVCAVNQVPAPPGLSASSPSAGAALNSSPWLHLLGPVLQQDGFEIAISIQEQCIDELIDTLSQV
jgi:hypothetical protein